MTAFAGVTAFVGWRVEAPLILTFSPRGEGICQRKLQAIALHGDQFSNQPYISAAFMIENAFVKGMFGGYSHPGARM